MKTIAFLLRDSRGIVCVAALSSALSGACTAMLLDVIHRANDPSAGGDRRQLLLRFALLALGFFLTTLASHLPLLHVTERATQKLRLHLVRSILRGRLRFLEQLGSHRLYASLASDIGRITDGLAVLPAILISLVVISSCLLYLALLSWQALVALLIFLAFAIFLFVLANLWAMRRLVAATTIGNSLFKQFEAVAEGMKELKLHSRRRRAFLDTMLVPLADAYRRTRISGLTGLETANAVANLGYFLVIGFLLFLLPAVYGLEPAVLTSTVLVFVFMLAPLTTLGNHLHTFASAGAALSNLEELGIELKEEEGGDDLERVVSPSPTVQAIAVRGLRYRYRAADADEQFELGPIDLEAHAGEILFITGGNGSGKSTLGKLLVGLYEPSAGSIHLNGEEISDQNREWYRQHFTAIFADFYLFERLLGLENQDLDARAQAYLDDLHLSSKVAIAGGRLSTTELSSGQRRRLALLVAYLEDRPVCLFDEWAADQDPQFKEIFYNQLLPELKARGKAVVVISHDDRYFGRADRLLKLVDGELVPAAAPSVAATAP